MPPVTDFRQPGGQEDDMSQRSDIPQPDPVVWNHPGDFPQMPEYEPAEEIKYTPPNDGKLSHGEEEQEPQ